MNKNEAFEIWDNKQDSHELGDFHAFAGGWDARKPEIADLKTKIGRLDVQLAGCSVAALGETKEPATQGQYGWSPAYQDVINLRLQHDGLQARLAAAEAQMKHMQHVVTGSEKVKAIIFESTKGASLAKLEALRAALEEFGQHDEGCVCLGNTVQHSVDCANCDCGLREAYEAAGGGK